MVHIELKRRGIALQEAFNQINRYQRESFWTGNRLYEYVHLFVVSNGTHTKYYSNTVRTEHLKKAKLPHNKPLNNTSNSFEFTNWWAKDDNKPICDLMDFGKTFFDKHSLLNIITRYCVFTSDKLLLVMRPYQIVAAERILNRIEVSTNYKQLGSIDAGGFIWHTTGSGKTLTSFKVAQLASQQSNIDKVLFVVDRKDLDYQTMKEYDKFKKGAANSNTNTAKLKKQLEDSESQIIITTIQKLDKFIKQNAGHPLFNKHIVLIFDECHRSQFGNMHRAITSNFKQYNLFGFTGTPIFAKNALSSNKINLKTTKQAFGEMLHKYTIVEAITDKNVLPFRIDYWQTFHAEAGKIDDDKVRDINREKAFSAPKRITNVVRHILKHFNQKTMRHHHYTNKVIQNVYQIASARHHSVAREKTNNKVRGFNSIFAVNSIDMAKLYYVEFGKQLTNIPEVNHLKVAIIFSYGINDPENTLESIEDENSEDTSRLDASSRDFLEKAIVDYNKMFNTNYDTSSDKFQNYYKDVSMRMKNKEIDILIVVNMFLTGFDATTLNTLWADKNLRMHGLLQAYSRTNRILNSVKTFGSIITFRNLEQATNEAIALFGDKEAKGIVLLKSFPEYYKGYEENGKYNPGYADFIDDLTTKFPVNQRIIGEQNKKEFIKLYGKILRMRNILTAFDEFADKEILTKRDLQDYQSVLYRFISRISPSQA